MKKPPRQRQRPTPELLARLRASKLELHQRQADLPLKEKVRMVLKLQRLQLPLLARLRPLAAWERPWDVDP